MCNKLYTGVFSFPFRFIAVVLVVQDHPDVHSKNLRSEVKTIRAHGIYEPQGKPKPTKGSLQGRGTDERRRLSNGPQKLQKTLHGQTGKELATGIHGQQLATK